MHPRSGATAGTAPHRDAPHRIARQKGTRWPLEDIRAVKGPTACGGPGAEQSSKRGRSALPPVSSHYAPSHWQMAPGGFSRHIKE